MIFSDYKKSIFSKRMLLQISNNFLVVLGIVSLFLDILFIENLNVLQYGWSGVGAIIFVSLVIAILMSLPRESFSVRFPYPDVNIGLEVGDILKQKGNLVLGFSDTFDTEIGQVISGSSLQGQFLTETYGNNRQKLDEDLERALAGEPSTTDLLKTIGKNKRYKIGTVAVLQGENRKFLCCAYSKMGLDFKTSSDINNLWDSLNNLWAKIRISGEQKAIFIPVMGTNLARVPGISHALPIKIIVLSFIINSRIESIAKELTIIVHRDDLKKIDLLEIKEFIEALDR